MEKILLVTDDVTNSVVNAISARLKGEGKEVIVVTPDKAKERLSITDVAMSKVQESKERIITMVEAIGDSIHRTEIKDSHSKTWGQLKKTKHFHKQHIRQKK